MRVSTRLALSLVLVLTACGSEKKTSVSQDREGNCSSSFISGYNDIVRETKYLKILVDSSASTDAEKMAQLNTLNNACNRFFSNHTNVSCTAEVNYQTQQVSSNDHQSICSKVKTALNGTAQPTSTPTPTPSQVKNPVIVRPDDSRVLTTMKANELMFEVMDASTINKMIQNKKLGMVNGKVGTMDDLASDIRSGAAICYVIQANEQQELSMITGMTFPSAGISEKPLENGGRMVIIALADGSMGFACLKVGTQLFTLKEVRASLKGVIEISIQ